MSLTSENPRVHDLAREPAAWSGKAQTGAIEAALESCGKRVPTSAEASQHRQEQLQWDLDEFRKNLRESGEQMLAPDELYDEDGLPQ